jgi:hypothetical protein
VYSLFSPWNSEDDLNDQVLTSRCAALELLKVDLEHFGLTIAEEERSVLAEVVEAAGQGK